MTTAEIQFHEVSDIFPLMPPDEFVALKDDIAARGLLEAIWLHDGKIIDGRHRYLACRELGIEPEYRTHTGDNLVAFVVSLNLRRRHLTKAQSAAAAMKALPMLEVQASKRVGGRPEKGKERIPEVSRQARDEAATLFGVNPHYIQDAKAIQEADPELFDELASGTITVPEARREIAQKAKEARRHDAAEKADKIALPDLVQVWPGDFREKLAGIADGSVSLIFTDPPYDKESIPLYKDLAEHAARILKPGGSLLTFVGQYGIRQAIELMEPPLRYWWIVCVKHGGASARMMGPLIYVEWKPMLWFVKGKRGHDTFAADFIQSSPPDKTMHDWEQGLREAEYYIDKITDPGDLVVDPFLGCGTTLIAAANLKRRGIGIEIDEERAKTAAWNIHERFAR